MNTITTEIQQQSPSENLTSRLTLGDFLAANDIEIDVESILDNELELTSVNDINATF